MPKSGRLIYCLLLELKYLKDKERSKRKGNQHFAKLHVFKNPVIEAATSFPFVKQIEFPFPSTKGSSLSLILIAAFAQAAGDRTLGKKSQTAPAELWSVSEERYLALSSAELQALVLFPVAPKSGSINQDKLVNLLSRLCASGLT